MPSSSYYYIRIYIIYNMRMCPDGLSRLGKRNYTQQSSILYLNIESTYRTTKRDHSLFYFIQVDYFIRIRSDCRWVGTYAPLNRSLFITHFNIKLLGILLRVYLVSDILLRNIKSNSIRLMAMRKYVVAKNNTNFNV